MARASYLFDLLSHRERDKFLHFINARQEKQNEFNKERMLKSFQLWINVINHIKKIKQDEEQRRKVLEILRNSVRGQRSTMEKEILRRFVVNNLSCIPKTITFSEMDQLCNELDWYPLIGRSVIFLQGDFGNVYYMIAMGSVGLFLEPSKDREMAIAREFGNMRGQPFFGNEEDLKKFGNNILTLTAGNGFGEYAILATTNKIRSCAAVALDPESFLLIMQAETYNGVLRQHHYRQKQLSSATALLQELPLFKVHNYSKIASIAYTMKSQTYSSGTIIARCGDVINNVMLIASGQVKVFAPPSNQQETDRFGNDFNKVIEKRIPKLAVAMLGRGQIVGEIEISKGSRTFQMDYETSSATTEILEMPATTFKDSTSNSEIRQSMIYKSIEDINEEKEQRRVGRLTRAYDAVKKMMEGNFSERKAKEELMNILPSIVDPAVNEPPAVSSKNRRLSTIPLSLLESSTAGSDSVKVTRKLSFAVKNSDELKKVNENSPSSKGASGQSLGLTQSKAPNNPKKSSVIQSPRTKLSFTNI